MRATGRFITVALGMGVLVAAIGGAGSDPSRTLAAGVDTSPTFGQTMNTGLRNGDVFIRPEGEGAFHRLTGIETIPLGSSIDATDGRMWLQTQSPDGSLQSIDWFDGRFTADQDKSGLVDIDVEGANFNSCGDRSAKGKGGKKTLAKLWGNGNGKSRTKGRNGSGTVRGTIWLTEERCDGTLFKVREGIVKVRDFERERSVTLEAGDEYLANDR